jgi:hypothetical protein
MTEARQPKGIPAGGQFAATAHTEPELGLYPVGSVGDLLAKADSALAADGSRWDATKEALRTEDLERQQRRGRIAGVRAASRILNVLPEAATLSYTRNPVSGITTLDEIRNVDNNTIYSIDDLAGSAFRGRRTEEGERREAIRDAVRLLAGTSQPPEHGAQGITVHSNHERLDLATALEDGLGVLDAEELTPEQESTKRVETALAVFDTGEDPETTLRDMFTDLRHYAAKNGVDLGWALDRSYAHFVNESNDPSFKEGI